MSLRGFVCIRNPLCPDLSNLRPASAVAVHLISEAFPRSVAKLRCIWCYKENYNRSMLLGGPADVLLSLDGYLTNQMI